VILGGGDTGSDCLGTSNRQGAVSVHQFELLPMPPATRTPDMPWPDWPMILRTSTSHEEGVIRDWSINTRKFTGENGKVRKLHGVKLNWKRGTDGRMIMEEIPGSEFELECELVLLALGFLGPEPDSIVKELGLKLDSRSNIACENYQSCVPGVFAAGDARRGQSLVVWAIWEGRECACAVDAYLMGETFLPASPEL
jgi:glutamate synthase (NADPH/NADH) small chain